MAGMSTMAWWHEGERFFAAALDRLGPAGLDEPSLLPGWTRRTVVAHVARNADALGNLLTWARTGVETPMYPSAQARAAGIEETARHPVEGIVADYRASAQRLATAAEELPAAAWAAPVRSAQGRPIPAGEVPWMRCREVWVHAVDLGAGAGFADIPDDVLYALIDDVTMMWRRRGELPDVRISAGTRSWGEGAVRVSGELPDLTAYLTGRADATPLTVQGGALPELPAWL